MELVTLFEEQKLDPGRIPSVPALLLLPYPFVVDSAESAVAERIAAESSGIDSQIVASGTPLEGFVADACIKAR